MPTALEDLYAENYFAGADEGFGYVDYDADKEPMVGAFKKYLQHVRKLSPQAKSLLDVGAATGFFLDIARTDGFTVAGVEISEFAAQKGRDKGIEMTTGTLDQVSGTYDVISMLDLIEHVTDPRAELKKAHALLAEHGLLVINTPDAGSPYAPSVTRREKNAKGRGKAGSYGRIAENRNTVVVRPMQPRPDQEVL
jgi:2-polyprenyl-3-methyl-5-hydroxy-6-metoxy-1,4-benzoquinol methylase